MKWDRESSTGEMMKLFEMEMVHIWKLKSQSHRHTYATWHDQCEVSDNHVWERRVYWTCWTRPIFEYVRSHYDLRRRYIIV